MGGRHLPGKKITLVRYIQDKYDQVKMRLLYEPKMWLYGKVKEQKVLMSGPRVEVDKAVDLLNKKMKKFQVFPTVNQDEEYIQIVQGQKIELSLAHKVDFFLWKVKDEQILYIIGSRPRIAAALKDIEVLVAKSKIDKPVEKQQAKPVDVDFLI
jgi:hypothetical protein